MASFPFFKSASNYSKLNCIILTCFPRDSLTGMEVEHSLLSGGINKLNIRKFHKPPHVKKRMNSIPVRESQRANYVN